ncbi:amidohydrolase [Parahaliea mediterranea]|uniref:Amidohydrolase n=2 Tax=Parahaliea mediterranea TaxID=651086 RepID=A0A939DGK8_9GAMM|nr:amidohydrolase [Parahaliea mediterranea]
MLAAPLLAAPLLAAATEPVGGAGAGRDDAARADRLLHNARVYTLDPEQPWAEAVAIAGDRLVYVGDMAGAADYVDADTQRLDLGGKLVLPGFIDTHIHVGDTFPWVFAASLSPDMGPGEVLATVAEYARANPEQGLIIGNGFLGAAFGEQGPTAAQLDQVVPDRPVMLFDEGFHTAWINSKAMAMVGLDARTPDPVPGRHYYKRYPDGRPTGWLIEGGAFNWISEKLGVSSPGRIARGAGAFLDTMSSMGITAAFDAGMVDGGEATFALMERLVEEGELPVRIVGSLYTNTDDALATAMPTLRALNARFHSEFLDIRMLKVSLDGTVEAKTAYMLEPYVQPPGHRGDSLVSADRTRETVLRAARAGIDLHLHAIGDAAVRMGLDLAEAVREEVPDSGVRIAMCHIQVVDPADVPRFGELDVIAQSTATWYVYDDVAEKYLGPERLAHFYPLRSIAEGGARITLGTDYPASWIGLDGLNPLFNIEMAMTRQPAGEAGFAVQPPVSERITLAQAIRAYTLDAAYQLRLEHDIGSLRAGKQADLVVLSDNLFEIDTYAIHKARVLLTMVDGKIVYREGAE